IYPQPAAELVLVETHTPLERQIAAVRHTATNRYLDARTRLQGVVDRWIGVEHAIERRVKSLKANDESLTPGALYVGVATLTGSVLARNRNFLLRFSLPPALFLLSMNHFLPKTSQNISSYLSSLERAHVPALAHAHEQFNGKLAGSFVAAGQAWYTARTTTIGGIERAVTELQDRTGLKLKEVLGWGQRAARKTEREAGDVLKNVEKKVEELRK
ncbi:apolipo protein O-domain-containing protein, partial [Hysterangium stoloniferum]